MMAWKTFISMLTHCSNEKQREVGSLYQNIFLYENIFFISKMDFRFYLEGASGKKYIYLIVESIDLKLWKQIGWGFLVLHTMFLHFCPACLHLYWHRLAVFILESSLIHFFRLLQILLLLMVKLTSNLSMCSWRENVP